MKERIEMVRAMETIIRNLNNEDYIDYWLMYGVADGDIHEETTDEELEWYAEDENFTDLMHTFGKIMKRVTKNEDIEGMFYCDGMIS